MNKINSNINPIQLYNFAMQMYAEKKYTEAFEIFKKTANYNETKIESIQMIAILYAESSQYDNALRLFELSSSIQADNFFTLNNRARVLTMMNRLDEAFTYLMQAIDFNPYFEDSYINIGNIHVLKNEYKNARINFEKALSLNPRSFNALANLGNVSMNEADYERAITYFDKAANIDSTNIAYKLSLAKANLLKGDLEKSKNLYNDVLIYFPENYQALLGLGLVESAKSNYIESDKLFDLAAKVSSECREAKYNKSLTLLFRGNYIEGWNNYHMRWKNPDFYMMKPEISDQKHRLWDGISDISELHVLAEQGLGDQILFASLISLLHKKVKQIVLFIDQKLINIFSENFNEIQIKDIKEYSVFDSKVHFISLADLGKIFITDYSCFKERRYPYLFINSNEKNIYRNKIIELSKTSKTKICGISWRSENSLTGHMKSIDLVELMDSIDHPDWIFVNLQYGNVRAEILAYNEYKKNSIVEFIDIDIFNDLSTLSKIISSCDKIITISNTTAHLAGAIGTNTHLLLPRNIGALWYWSENLGRNLWYPSIQIHRQKKQMNWSDPLNEIIL